MQLYESANRDAFALIIDQPGHTFYGYHLDHSADSHASPHLTAASHVVLDVSVPYNVSDSSTHESVSKWVTETMCNHAPNVLSCTASSADTFTLAQKEIIRPSAAGVDDENGRSSSSSTVRSIR